MEGLHSQCHFFTLELWRRASVPNNAVNFPCASLTAYIASYIFTPAIYKLSTCMDFMVEHSIMLWT